MLFAIGFVSLFVSGGLSGPFLAQPSLDIPLHDTYFVVAHFHLIMGVAAIFGMFAATYFWFPKMFGRMMNEPMGKLHFWITFIGVYAIFMPMHYLGMAGHPRRYSQLTELAYLHPLIPRPEVHDVRGVHHDRRAADLRLQFVLEHVQGSEGVRQSVGCDDAGVDHGHAAAARQFRRAYSGRA